MTNAAFLPACRLVAVSALVLTLSACAQPGFPYVQPQGLTPQNAATIIGSTTVNPDPVAPDTHVFLSEIDNLQTGFGWRDWKKPILVAPGTHLLTFGPCYCSAFLRPYAGTITLSVNFEAGKTYVLKADRAEGFGNSWKDEAWIADGNGTPITPKTGVVLGDAGGPEMVPIMVPAR